MSSDSNQNSDCYKSIASPSRGLYKEKGSKFIAFAHPVETLDEVKDIISSIKKEYYDARHHCYAYRIGPTGDIWRANDDGEPSSTGGKPIHGQLLSNSLSDIIIVVVRYFGGIKLGVPGLINAYRTAACDAIANAEIVTKTATERFTLRFGYLQMNEVMKSLKDMSLQPISQDFDNECRMDVKVPLSRIDIFKETFKNTEICQKV